MWPTSKGKNFYVCFLEWGYWMAANRLKLNTDKTKLFWVGSKSGSAPLGSKDRHFNSDQRSLQLVITYVFLV